MKMKVLVLLLLLPSLCGNVESLRTPKIVQYRYDIYNWNWTLAQNFCRTYHTDLVTIRNEEENQHFYGFSGWIGLYREDTDSPWKWSTGEETAGFTPWESNEPLSHEHCAFKFSGKEKWEGAACGAIRSTLCFDERLVLVKKRKTWEEALEYCREMRAVDISKPASVDQNYRYDLATLKTPDDQDFANEMIQQADSREVWTGLRYLAGGWMWVGGETVESQDFVRCPKKKLCAIVVKNSTRVFLRRDCEKKKNFLCYRKD